MRKSKKCATVWQSASSTHLVLFFCKFWILYLFCLFILVMSRKCTLTAKCILLGAHRESKTPNFIQSRIFENPTVIRSNFAQFAPNNVLKGKIFGYFLGFSIIYRIKSRSNTEKYPIMIRILSNQVIGYFLERDWVFGRSIFTERIFFGVFGSLWRLTRECYGVAMEFFQVLYTNR